LPFDAQAQREASMLGNEGADARATLASDYALAQNKFGFGTGTDNPYSEQAENRRVYAADRRGVLNTAGNSLYSGSTLNKVSEARGRYDRNQKAINEQIARAQSDYTGGVAKTARDEALGMAGIKGGAIERAAAAEPAPLAPGGGRRRGRGRRPQVGAVKPQTNRRRGRI
jgi:hypothetical protein